jgi:hypothetical protein
VIWPPRIAVVICAHNRPAALERCLRRLKQINGLACSIVVVDSAPNSSDMKSVAIRYGAQYILSPVNGLSRARNIGTRATHADVIAHAAPCHHRVEWFETRGVWRIAGIELARGLVAVHVYGIAAIMWHGLKGYLFYLVARRAFGSQSFAFFLTGVVTAFPWGYQAIIWAAGSTFMGASTALWIVIYVRAPILSRWDWPGCRSWA